MQKILITGAVHKIVLNRLEEQANITYDFRPDLPYAEIIKIIHDYDGIITRSETKIDRNMLDHATKLSVIARAAVGVGNIDIEYATQKGVLVFNTPGKNTNSAAELTLLQILTVLRNLTNAHQSVLENQWNRHVFIGNELRGKVVGIIGLGNVGHRVARFVRAFECEVLTYDPYVTEKYCESHYAKKVGLNQLLTESDIITVHVPKNNQTNNMISDAEIAQMKDGVILINTARGGVMNEQALEQALINQKIRGLAIDTWENEPLVEHPLKKFPNVVCTPHIGGSTHEAQYLIGSYVAEEIIQALEGGIVSSPINMPKMRSLENTNIRSYSVLAERLGIFSQQFIMNNFEPQKFEFLYRGKIDQEDWQLIKLAFMKGFLKGTVDTEVTYVNALQITEQKGFEIIENHDQNFTMYESAIRISIAGSNGQCIIGGTVFDKQHFRLTYLDGFSFEAELKGRILVVKNKDIPGVIGHVGTVLAQNQVNINQFELSRIKKGGNAMAMILIDEKIDQSVLHQLKQSSSIETISFIEI